MKPTGEYVRSFFSITSNIIPSPLLFSPSQKIILPFYHTISDAPLPHIRNLYHVKNEAQFVKDLEFILKHFEPIDLHRLKEMIYRKEKVTKNYFHLSFDDGLRECFEIIAPILKNKGIPATFFINPFFVDNKDLMHRYKVSVIIENLKNSEQRRSNVVLFFKKKLGVRRDAETFLLSLRYPHHRFIEEICNITETDFCSFLQHQRPYLTTSQIREMLKDGFTFGGHSLDHPEYFMISEEEQLRQTTESIRYVQNNFKIPYRVFAFPFTDHLVSSNLFKLIHTKNAPLADLTFGVAGIKSDIHLHHLQRIPMEKKFSAKEILKGEYLYFYLKSLLNKNVIRRR